MTFYKVLSATGRSCHNGRLRWSLPRGRRPGAWMYVAGKVALCVRGLHLTDRPRVWFDRPDRLVFEAEVDPGVPSGGRHEDKRCVGGARLVRRVSDVELVALGCYPVTVCPVVRAFAWASWRPELAPLYGRWSAPSRWMTAAVLRSMGSVSVATQRRRGWMAIDWIVREYLPAWLEVGRDGPSSAATLRAGEEILNGTGLRRACEVIKAMWVARPVFFSSREALVGESGWFRAWAAVCASGVGRTRRSALEPWSQVAVLGVSSERARVIATKLRRSSMRLLERMADVRD